MKILFFGDVVGKPGRRALSMILPDLVAEEGADLVVANGENASAGFGLDPKTLRELRSAGVRVVTTGNHVWAKKAVLPILEGDSEVLRPANFAPGVPGRGWTVVEAAEIRVAVVNVIGRVFMPPADCPFRAMDAILSEVPDDVRVIVVDVHAEATSEKVALGRHLDGRVSFVVGTHTHVPTADETVLPGGTAYLTDAGMCGPVDSVIGMQKEGVLRRFLDQLPERFEVAGGDAVLNGVAVEIDERSGRARSIRRIQRFTEELGLSE